MQGKDGQQRNKQHLFSISINVYLIRYQFKSNSHTGNYEKCLENMTVKQEQEH